MEIKTSSKIQVVLTLSEEEAKWLKGIMQNPLYGDCPSDEDPIDAKYRKMYWEVLKT